MRSLLENAYGREAKREAGIRSWAKAAEPSRGVGKEVEGKRFFMGDLDRNLKPCKGVFHWVKPHAIR
ncbi:hypothetical protein Poly24_44070 [Rosistilla carotiformis]|uniref:Uncharacterized protein n=1 Tax=Rosistilla carotiformis TaxID=2528017 RepID=A0A518JYR8_9BACT|nr:hypothetical protein Poly24_44070 [Rosistilla carotiformis]